MTGDPIIVFASFHAGPGKQQELRELLSWMVENTRTEPGCVSYDLYRRQGADEVFCLFERYRTDEALQAHRGAPYYIEYRRRVVELIEGSVDVVLFDPIDAAG